ncbi:MAG: OB-fold nucleic acid binding domain-containing protein [Actinomycetes bacterium]
MGRGNDVGLIRRAVRKITTSEQELDAAELREDVVDELGGTPVADCRDREPVCVAGQIRAVTLRPVGGVPALEAELYDGDDTVSLVFLGRRNIPGIEPGRMIVAHGRLRREDSRALIYNPRYELRPAG